MYSLKNSETDNLCRTSFVKSSNDNIVLSILKVAEDEEGIIIRLYNASNDIQITKIDFSFVVKEVWKTKLNEEKKNMITNSNEFEVSFKPWEIITLFIK